MRCPNCQADAPRVCVCLICNAAGCPACFVHSLPVFHVEHDNDRCPAHFTTFAAPPNDQSLKLEQIVLAVTAAIKDKLSRGEL